MIKCFFKICNIIVAVFVVCEQGIVFAGEKQAAEFLSSTVQKFKHLRFQASGVYIRPSGLLAFDVNRVGLSERVTEHGSLERYMVNTPLTQLTVYPERKKGIEQRGRVNFQALAYLNSNLNEGLKNYELLSDSGPSPFAGRLARRLSVTPKINDRYSYVFWIDEQSGAVLRLDIIDENKALIERMVLTSFALKPSLPTVLISDSPEGFDWVRQRFKPILRSELTLSWIPAGFKLYSIERIEDAGTVAHCERLILTDGFAVVEIYSCENGHSAKLTMGRQLDALHIIKRHLGGKELSIEGRLPSTILNKIAENIEIKND